MRRSVIYFVFFFFLLLYGCKTATEQGNSIGVDLDGGQDSFDLAALLDTTFYDIVPLETDSACMIGEVSDLFFDGGRFYIVDKTTGGIFVFDRQGKFLFKIQSMGRGAKEYTELTGVYFTEDRFYMYDPSLGKLLVFNAQGHFVEGHAVPGIWAFDIFVFRDRVYYLNDWEVADQGCYRLYSTDLQGGDLRKMLPFPEEESGRGWGCSKYYSLADGRAAFIYSSIDTLYCLDDDGGLLKYYVDFGKYKMPEAYALKSAIELLKLKALDKYTLGLDGIWETKNYFFGKIAEPYRWLVFDKQSQQFSVVKNLQVSSFLGMAPWFCRDEYLICSYPASPLIGTYNDLCEGPHVSANFKSLLKSKVEGLSEMDNPVLFLYKLKDGEY